MSLFGDIASTIGHTVDSLAEVVGADVSMLETVVNDLDGNGINVFSAATKLGLSAEDFLRGIVDIIKGDPHQLLLERLTGPIKRMKEPLSQLSQHWMQVAELHQGTAQTVDTHVNALYQDSGSSSYKGPAADTLWETHQDYHKHFTPLVEHAQTQQMRYATLQGHVDSYQSQMSGHVNNLSAPTAALAVLSIDTVTGTEPPIIDEWIRNLTTGEEEFGGEDPRIGTIIEGLICALVIFAFLWNAITKIIEWIGDRIRELFAPSKPLPPGLPPPQPPPGVLTTEQEQMADRLSKDYGIPLDDIRAIIAANPNLSEAALRKLLDRYSDVIKKNPNLVKKYGALAVFKQFIALAAYDPAHGGNYPILKPAREDQLDKGGMDEAEAELGAMEMGLVKGPMTPSTDPKYEGTDANGQAWDVKSPRSATFDAEGLVDGMQKDFNNTPSENIILDDRNITPKEIQELYEELKARGQDNRVVWWPTSPTITP